MRGLIRHGFLVEKASSLCQTSLSLEPTEARMKSHLSTIVAVLLWLLSSTETPAQVKPMPQPLWPKGAPGAKGQEKADVPQITVYLPPAERATGAAIVICPGGGYRVHAMDHEGHQIGRWLNGLGIAGIILEYRLGPRYNHPA